MGMKSRKRMEEEKKQNKKNYIGLKHSMKTMRLPIIMIQFLR